MKAVRRIILQVLFLCTVCPCIAQQASAATVMQRSDETESSLTSDTTTVKKTFLYRMRKPIRFVKRFIDLFSDYDTAYVEPNHYNWATMLQGTTSHETLSLRERDNTSLLLGSRPGIDVGPYLGWGIFFFGYTVDLTTIGKPKPQKTEFELSFYTTFINGDLFYRHTGDDFSLTSASLPGNSSSSASFDPYKGQQLEGIDMSMIGANLYYIVNRRRFSLPAGFAQSTVQRKSAGTLKFGLSITHHSIDIDYGKLAQQMPPLQESTPFQTEKMEYMDYSLSAGYAYNWVFRRNWLLSFDFSPAIGYKRTHRSLWLDSTPSDATETSENMHNFFVSRGNVNFNVTGRLGFVWNNGHHYAGLSLVAHNFNYNYHMMEMHNSIVTLRLYTGLNFMRKKAYK